MEMNYEVRVTRDADAWMVDVPQVQRVTMALSLQEVEVMAQDLIHIMTGEALESITLDVHVLLPDTAQASMDAVRH